MKVLLVLVLIVSTIWCTVNLYLGAGAAPLIFAHAQPAADALFSREVAGALFGDVLWNWHMAVTCSLLPILAALLIFLGIIARHHHRILTTACVCFLLTLGVLHVWSFTIVKDALALRPPVESKTSEQLPATSDEVARMAATARAAPGDLNNPLAQSDDHHPSAAKASPIAPPPYSEADRAAFNHLHRQSVQVFSALSLALLALAVSSAVALILERNWLGASAQGAER